MASALAAAASAASASAPSTAAPGGLSAREAAILAGVIDLYLATGVPVGSRAIAGTSSDHPSPATIRHVLADLERSGYLQQPHTSAGRVPTAQAIRWSLKQMAPPALAAPVRELERLLLHDDDEAGDAAALWGRACAYLSEATGQVGLIVVRPWRDAGLKHLRFFRLAEHRVLAILVAGDGQVRERVTVLPELYTQPELDMAANYFLHNFAGWTLTQIRRELRHRLEEERAAYDGLLKRVLVLSHCGALHMEDAGAVYVHGAGHLAKVLDSHQLANMLERLNQKERWLSLLAEIGDADEDVEWNTGGPTHVRARVGARVGLDAETPDLALIAACYERGSAGGAIGVLGSTRMPYERALSAVALVNEFVSRVLGDYPA